MEQVVTGRAGTARRWRIFLQVLRPRQRQLGAPAKQAGAAFTSQRQASLSQFLGNFAHTLPRSQHVGIKEQVCRTSRRALSRGNQSRE